MRFALSELAAFRNSHGSKPEDLLRFDAEHYYIEPQFVHISLRQRELQRVLSLAVPAERIDSTSFRERRMVLS